MHVLYGPWSDYSQNHTCYPLGFSCRWKMSVFNLEEYMSHIYRNIWSDVYNHIQDVLFFTRAELYPIDLSTKDMLTLQLNWLTIDKEW